MIQAIRHFYKAWRSNSRRFDEMSALRIAIRGRIKADADALVHVRQAKPSRIYLRPRTSDLLTYREIFDEEVYRSVLDHLDDECNIVDLGANVGLAARYFLTHRPRARLLAVEAMPSTYRVLEKNLDVQLVGTKVRTSHVAVWSHNQGVVLNLPMANKYSRVTALEDSKPESKLSVSVPSQTLDQILSEAGIDQIDLLKIDIEGAEVELLKNFDAWQSHVNCIAIEFHGNSRADSHFDSLMSSNGFRVINETDHTVVAKREQ